MGPQLRFSFDQLDIGKVFVGSVHSYEVSAGGSQGLRWILMVPWGVSGNSGSCEQGMFDVTVKHGGFSRNLDTFDGV